MQSKKIVIVILAAGASSRMQKRKQLLKWNNTTMLEHAIKTAKASNATKVKVVLGASYEEIIVEIKDRQIEYLINKDWKQGIGKSIAFGIENIASDFGAAIIMLADQPLIDVLYLNKLIETFQNNNSKIIATKYKNKVGVPALFGSSYFTKLQMLNSDYGARQLLVEYEKDVLCVEAGGKTVDIDTEEDYKSVLKLNKKS